MDYKLRKNGDPILSQVCKDVDLYEDIGELLIAMDAILKFNNALGLAAPQVGELKRVILVRCPDQVVTMINPTIIRTWGGKASIDEQCLSYPNFKNKIPRDKFIQVSFYNRDFKPETRKFKNLQSIIVQHEIDHLNGITIKNRSLRG